MQEEILQILAANKKRQEEAKRLNFRARQDLLKVYSQSELVAWVTERLAGARRMAEVLDAENLRLPDLDSVLVGKVLADNPDRLFLQDVEYEVIYSDIYGNPVNPTVRTSVEANDWKNFPEEGIFLPGGRPVSVAVKFLGYGNYVTDTDMKLLKNRVVQQLNKRLWETFHMSVEKPTLITPDPADPNSQISEVCKHQYGICGVMQSPLFAFGTVVLNQNHHYTSDSWFGINWFQTAEQAETERSKAVAKLSELREERRVTLQKATQAALEETERRLKLEIRKVSIDRRGQYHTPGLNGCRIDNRGGFPLTATWFWDDLLGLVNQFSRGVEVFALYNGENPLLLSTEEIPLTNYQAEVKAALMRLGQNPDDEAKKKFWTDIARFRPEITSPKPVVVRQEKPVSSGSGFGSLEQAFQGLDLKF